MNDLATSAEYFFCLIPCLIFIYIFYDIFIKEYKPRKPFIIALYIFLAFITCFYNEFVNIFIFSFCIFFLSFLFLFNRKKSFNKYGLILILPFLIGFICYYFFSGNATDNLSVYDYTITEGIKNLQMNFIPIMKAFFYTMFVAKSIFWLVILILIIFVYKLEYNKKNVLFFCISLLFSYILVNFASVFVCDLVSDTEYLFERPFWDILYINIIEMICLCLLGVLYTNEKIKKIISIILVITTLMLFYQSCQYYTAREDILFDIKKLIYRIDKINLIYTTLGESAIFPEKYLEIGPVKHSSIFSLNFIFNWEERLQKDKYINAEYLHYVNYFNRIYDKQYKGVIFKDDKFALEELEKRLILFDEKIETDDDLKKSKIHFDKMYTKYKGLILTLSDIQEMEDKYGNLPVLDKARAFIYFNNKEYETALKLYKEYLKIYPDDIDSLIYTGDIYRMQKKYKEAEYFYKKLISMDSNNLLFWYKLLCLYYYDMSDYNKAERVCNKIIEIDPELNISYRNMITIQNLLKDKDDKEIQEYINKAMEISPETVQKWMNDRKFDGTVKYDIEYPSF